MAGWNFLKWSWMIKNDITPKLIFRLSSPRPKTQVGLLDQNVSVVPRCCCRRKCSTFENIFLYNIRPESVDRTIRLSPGSQVCDCQTMYRVSIAQWSERWHGTTKALGSNPGSELTFHRLWHIFDFKMSNIKKKSTPVSTPVLWCPYENTNYFWDLELITYILYAFLNSIY